MLFTAPKAQIYVINVRIYHFKQTYGMNCIVRCVLKKDSDVAHYNFNAH